MTVSCVKVITILLAVSLLLLSGCSQGPEEANERMIVTDDLGRDIALPQGKLRAAVLLASFADGWLLAGGEIAATVHDAWEDYDLALNESAVDLGPYNGVSMELLIAVEPDLVIASANTKAQVDLMGSFEEMGLPVLYFSVGSFEEYLSMLSVLTRITGRTDLYAENGLRVQKEVERARQDAADAAKGSDPQRVLILRASTRGIHAVGTGGSVLGAMFRDLGCVNIADGSILEGSLSLEKILMDDPDRIFIVLQGSHMEDAEKLLETELTSTPGWPGLTAVKNGRVHHMDRHLYHLKPNKRWGEAYRKLEALLYADDRK